MKSYGAELLSKDKKGPGVYLFALSSEGLEFKPGQFVNIKCSDNADFILRRPISIFNADKDSFQILFEVKGKGTKALSLKEPGGKINVLGPLGNGFTLNENALLVAGGMGIAPLNFLAASLEKAAVIAGGRSKDALFTFGLKHTVYKATDDGSEGFKGTAGELLDEKIGEIKPDFIYSCGPEPLLKKVVEIAAGSGIKAEVSAERYMACGTGVCLSCVCKTKDGYKRVCREGPVFSGDEFFV